MNSTILPGALHHRAADDRFHSRLDWLDSRHSFSFAGHDDPAWRGFGLHPHRDMEIVTVMVAGQLEHRDSMGHGAVLHSDEVQRMSAGTGLMHSEHNPGPDPCRLLQIWIEPLQQGLSPSYEQTRLPCGTGGGLGFTASPGRLQATSDDVDLLLFDLG